MAALGISDGRTAASAPMPAPSTSIGRRRIGATATGHVVRNFMVAESELEDRRDGHDGEGGWKCQQAQRGTQARFARWAGA